MLRLRPRRSAAGYSAHISGRQGRRKDPKTSTALKMGQDFGWMDERSRMAGQKTSIAPAVPAHRVPLSLCTGEPINGASGSQMNRQPSHLRVVGLGRVERPTFEPGTSGSQVQRYNL
jgi:hypothetical protein